MSTINSQIHGNDGIEHGRVNDSDGGTTVTEEVIAHVLGRAHREAQARHAPHEARAILYVAHLFADVLGEMNPRFNRAGFIQTATESIFKTMV